MGVDDPRLRRSIKSTRNSMFLPKVFTMNDAAIRPVAIQKSRYSLWS